MKLRRGLEVAMVEGYPLKIAQNGTRRTPRTLWSEGQLSNWSKKNIKRACKGEGPGEDRIEGTARLGVRRTLPGSPAALIFLPQVSPRAHRRLPDGRMTRTVTVRRFGVGENNGSLVGSLVGTLGSIRGGTPCQLAGAAAATPT